MIFQKFILFLIIITNTIENETQIETFNKLIKKYLSNPEMNKAYLSYKQYINFTKKISKDFPDLINTSSIGETYLKNQMPLISFKSNTRICLFLFVSDSTPNFCTASFKYSSVINPCFIIKYVSFSERQIPRPYMHFSS